jgi:hypothetical protein
LKKPSAALLAAYQTGYSLQVSTHVYAEWNMNRFVDGTVTDNGVAVVNPDRDTIWPKDSVLSFPRPARGIIRGRLSSLSGSFTDDTTHAAGLEVGAPFTDAKPAKRYYLVSNDDTYKYWTSEKVTSGSSNAQGTFFFPEAQSLQVVYEKPVKVNKIVIGLETSESYPKGHNVYVTTDGSTWQLIASNPAVADDGRITVWYSDAWIVNKPSNFSNDSNTVIKGVKISAAGMDKQGAPFSVIELSARYQQELSEYLVNESSNLEVADTSNIAPLGAASSNKATVTLDNSDGRFYNEGTGPYAGLLDKNVKMWCDYTINSESFRQWTMFTDTWDNQMTEEVGVSLYDNAEFLQNIKTGAVFWQGLTVGSVMWRLLDIAGISEWNYSSSVDDVSELPFYWNDPEATVWENISNLATATQTSIYFDEYNVAQIRNAKSLFATKPPVWNFSAEENAGILPDIVSMNKSSEYEANQVDIKYTEMKFTDFNNGLPKMEVVWEPEDTVVLRASPLLYDMTDTQKIFTLPIEQAATWPLTGMANIEGEIISYSGKYYRSYLFFENGSSAYSDSLVKSEDERKKLDELTPEGIRWRNGYSGSFLIDKRGLFGTTAKPHSVNSKKNYTYEVVNNNSTSVEHWAGGVTKNPDESTVTLKGRNNFTSGTLYTLRTTDAVLTTNYRYGTRIRFPSAGQPVNKGAGGLYIKGGSFNSGFYVDLAPTDLVEAITRTRNELRFMVRTRAGGSVFGTQTVPVQINRDTWYDLEASTQLNADGTMSVQVYLDGVLRLQTKIKASEISDPKGKFGVFIRDNCIADFDYLYAVGTEDNADPDNSSFYDNVKGAYLGNYFDAVIPYQQISQGIVSRNTRDVRPSGSVAGQQWLDEFGPVVHEIRRYDVDFEKSPVAHSYLYFSNDQQITCPTYLGDAFGATFLLANTFRRNAIVSGEDTLTFGEDNSIDQKIFVYGRAFSDEDQQTETVKSEELIRKRGLNAITFDSTFVQSSASAKRLGQWIIDHWGNGTEDYQLEIFGNPFLSLGDIVTVSYAEKEIYPNTKFCIISLNNKTDTGIGTSLTLRRL